MQFIGVTNSSPYYANITDYALRKEERWDQRCHGIEGMLRHNLLAYTVQPVPHPGRVFFGSAFFSRSKIRASSYFGEYHVHFCV